jgi:hypoxanthine phosphoribosyltransferase
MANQILKTAEEIDKAIEMLCEKIMGAYPGESIDLISLNHAPELFTPDLSKSLNMDIRLQKLEFENYDNRTESGEVRIIRDLDQPIFGRDIILTDGIIISGITHYYLCKLLKQRSPRSIAIASIAAKPSLLKKDLPICYTLFNFDKEMIEGYGMGTDDFKFSKSLFDIR